jgi:hypothetical protein
MRNGYPYLDTPVDFHFTAGRLHDTSTGPNCHDHFTASADDHSRDDDRRTQHPIDSCAPGGYITGAAHGHSIQSRRAK